MNVVALTKKLISIPSFVNKNTNEVKLANFVLKYIKANFPFLKVIKKQPIEKGRFNLFVSDGYKTKLLFACHLDTVEPQIGRFNSFKGAIVGNRVYGLGAKDMKGGIAALLASLKNFEKTRGLGLLFYADEEYEMKGIKKVAKEPIFSRPKLILSPESRFQIGNARRGLVVIKLEVKGKAAHTGRPQEGRNAIFGLTESVKFLEKQLSRKRTFLGKSSVVLTSIEGGLGQDLSGEFLIKKQANVVPDIASGMLTIRPADFGVTAKKIINYLRSHLSKNNFKLKDYQIIQDYPPSIVDRKKLKILEGAIKGIGEKVQYNNPKITGFNDVVILADSLKTDFVNFGPDGGNNHKPDEYVLIESLIKTQKVYEILIKKICV